jgi:type II secretory pathway component GspD/PulD (secretin)
MAAPGHAQGLEIVPLRHRTVEQVLPVLRPLLEPGGTLSGHSNQLFIRASPANVADLRRVLETIDRPLRRLQISVRFDHTAETARRDIGAGGIMSNRGSRIDIRAEDSRSRSDERVDQRLQLIEGGRGVIHAGQSLQTHDRATGFVVVPRLSGETVQVDIAPQQESGESFQRASTTVSARLGEWFEIGGAATGSSRDGRGIASANRSSSAENRRIWLKVDEVRY